MRRDRHSDSGVSFWLISIGLHGIVLCALILTPAREIFFPPEEVPERPDITVRDEKLEKIVDDIRRSEADALADRVALLAGGAERMNTNYETFRVRFERDEADMAANAEARARRAAERLREDLASMITRLERAIATDSGFENVADSAAKDISILINTSEAFRQSLLRIPYLETAEALYDEHRQVDERFEGAGKHLRWMGDGHSGIQRTRDQIAYQEKSIEEQDAEIDRQIDRAAGFMLSIDKQKTAIAEKRAELERTERNSERRKIERSINDHERNIQRLERDIDRAKNEMGNAENRMANIRGKIGELETNVADQIAGRNKNAEIALRVLQGAQRQFEAVLEKLEAELAPDGEAIPVEPPSYELEDPFTSPPDSTFGESAARSQSRVRTMSMELPAIFGMLGGGGSQSISLTIPLFFGQAAPDSSFAVDQKVVDAYREQVGQTTDLVRLYDDALDYTAQVCEDYRRIRAIQLSRIRGIPFREAYDNIQSVFPEVAEINRELLSKPIGDPSQIEPHKKEVQRVKSEVEAMIELVKRLLLEIERIQAEIQMMEIEQEEPELEEILQQEQFDPDAAPPPPPPPDAQQQQTAMQKLEELATESETEQAKDLSPIMREYPNVQDLTREELDDQLMQDFELFKNPELPAGLRNLAAQTDNYTHVRKIGETGEPREWLFVDTWYIIGPFDNQARANLNKQFPPETVVDLDASYPGKDGRIVRWEFHQSRGSRVNPLEGEEYAVYYAFTEIYSDAPRDLWVAIGSDDKGNVWLNDLPIWISGDKLKGWKINEGYRKVHFQEGVNRILFRVENGWLSTYFSLSIYLGE